MTMESVTHSNVTVTYHGDVLIVSDHDDDIRPTGTCFDDAVQRMVGLIRERPEATADLRLVHAVVDADGLSGPV